MVMKGLFSQDFWYRLIKEFDTMTETKKPRPTAILMHLFTEIAMNSFIDDFFPIEISKRQLNKGFVDKVDFLKEKGVIEQDTYDNMIQINKIRVLYVHIRNLEDLDPDEAEVRMLLDSIKYREGYAPKQKKNLTDILFTTVMDVLLYQLQEDFVNAEMLRDMKSKWKSKG